MTTKTDSRAYDLVYPSAGLLILCDIYTLYLLITLEQHELKESFAGFYLAVPMLLGVLGVVVSLLAGGWRPIPSFRARRLRLLAVSFVLGSVLFIAGSLS